MGDVLAAINVAAEGMSLCVKAISAIKKFSDNVRSAASTLVMMLKRLERTRNLLELLRVALTELRQTSFSDMALALDGELIKATLQNVLRLASNTVDGQTQIGVYNRIRWAFSMSTTKQLLGQLETQEKDLLDVLMVVTAYGQLLSDPFSTMTRHNLLTP